MKTTLQLFAILSLVFAVSASAAEKKAANESEKPATKTEAKAKTKAKQNNTYPLYGQVVAITSRTLTIKGGEGKEDRKYTINADTVITKNDKPATTADVKEGQWVGGLVEKATDGNDKVLKLNLSAKQKPAAKSASKESETTKSESKSKKKAE